VWQEQNQVVFLLSDEPQRKRKSSKRIPHGEAIHISLIQLRLCADDLFTFAFSARAPTSDSCSAAMDP
jgi:hypothetical protein